MESIANGTVGSVSFQAPVVQSVSKFPLTKREFEVLELMAEGITTKAIGNRLGVTFKTAACHRGRILQKLGVESTVSAVRWAIRQGLITP
jgi:two-component system, NarL family, response regulator NreC